VTDRRVPMDLERTQ